MYRRKDNEESTLTYTITQPHLMKEIYTVVNDIEESWFKCILAIQGHVGGLCGTEEEAWWLIFVVIRESITNSTIVFYVATDGLNAEKWVLTL